MLALLVLSLLAVTRAQSWAQAPEYIIDLDADPTQRWNQVVEDYKQDFGPIMQYFNKIISPEIQKILDPILADLDKYIPAPYGDELRGVAAAAAPLVSLGQMVAVNLMYELTAFCTSIVAQGTNDTIFHSRNLDYEIPGLRALTIQVDFQSKNQTVYKGATWAGYVGLLTGMRPGAFGYSVDERDTPNGSMLDNLYSLLANKGGSVGFSLRTSLAEHTSFSEAVVYASHIPLMAPVYIIVSGAVAGEGAVVTRDREFALDVWPIGFNSQDDNGVETTDPTAWYRVQTNYDRWNVDPAWDRRRVPAEQALQTLGQSGLSLDALFNILSTPPVFNSGTIYTCLMSATLGEMTTFVRWDANATAIWQHAAHP